ncbi:hypothetical protein BDR07DRAFT_1396984 [Suillus spraguei]|nr:hypothetical protein BDR07DRAFT_1396984 [Suillus spraguei]
MDNRRDSGNNRCRCCNIRYWSRMSTTICPDCIIQDSFARPCGRYWTCGGCESQASVSGILTCPGCHQRFCPSCSYIVACELCEHVEPCRDCINDGKNIEVEHSMFQCGGCKGLLICELYADEDSPDIVCDECRVSIDNEDMAYGDYP